MQKISCTVPMVRSGGKVLIGAVDLTFNGYNSAEKNLAARSLATTLILSIRDKLIAHGGVGTLIISYSAVLGLAVDCKKYDTSKLTARNRRNFGKSFKVFNGGKINAKIQHKGKVKKEFVMPNDLLVEITVVAG